jgi:hypothetical protein
MYCSVCGGSIDGEAPVCSSCGTRQPVAEAPALPQPLFPQQGSYTWKQPRSYNWGQIHGGLCFLGGVSLLSNPFAMRLPCAIFLLVLGLSILRRNKLILPLLSAGMVFQLMLILAYPRQIGWLSIILAIACWIYYYRRRADFVTWL